MIVALALVTILLAALGPAAAEIDMPNEDRIRPYAENPRYWQYRGEPVLLLGGSKDDNLFQIPDLEEHLDLLASVGGNCIRNTMSDRQDFGFEAYPYKRLPDGKYDLDEWNDEYWQRFETMLRLTSERDIFVQIEVWDRFDYSQQNWDVHPYNPQDNVNYTAEESGLAVSYPQPAWRDQQPFFHCIPGMAGYEERLDTIRGHQERFVAKMLSYSLPHGHVLYCMDNETSTHQAWGQHWMAFIQNAAAERGVDVFTTDMFDDCYQPARSDKLRQAIDNPDVYPFIDISQINSRSFGEEQWTRLMWIVEQVEASGHPRPLNCTKIYCDGDTQWGSGTPKDGPERFWRDLLAGCASARFHRDGGGIGLNELAQGCIRSGRLAESIVRLWDVTPQMGLLSDRAVNEAYLAADPGQSYLLFMSDGGSVGLDLAGVDGTLEGRWINVGAGEWGPELSLQGGATAQLEAPGAGPWVAALAK